MKKILFFLAALVGMTLAGCTDDEFVGNVSPPVVEEEMNPILFTSNQKAFTRADITGADAANLLNGKFVVTGFKGSSADSKNTATPGSIVFDNYLVQYEENSANTTESNSANWEYVGKGPIPHATTNGITKQTIKYWDYTQTQYDFIAWGMGKVDVSGTPTAITPIYTDVALGDHEVRVSAISPNGKSSGWPTGGTLTRPSYTFEGKAEDLAQCYISDLVTVYKGAPTGSAPFYNVVANGYNKPVTLKFRQLGTKVRIGIYETVPGYSVKDVQFYNAATVALVKAGDEKPTSGAYTAAEAATENASAKIFTTVANGIYKEGTYTVYFPTVDDPTNADNNQAHIEFEAKTGAAQKTTVDWGGLNYTFRESGEELTDAKYLGRTSNTASFAGDADKNYYVVYLPNANGTNLNLRVNYTLESIDGSKETITVKGATAQVPSIYTSWKPGYAYTYLFKISDKTNGYTGVYDPTKPDDTSVNSDPAGLYPITFDAVVVNAEEDATQETITTVSTPSITTYQKGSNVVNKNEYDHATGDIYVTVNDADAATYSAADPQPTTGASVANYYTNTGTTESPVWTPCAPDAVAVDGTTYYKKIEPALPNGNLATLTGKAALYTIPAGKTEAEVVDAMSLQDENATGAATGTITGRSGLVLTPANSVADAASISAAGDYALTDKVEYGADGNTITISTAQALRFRPAAGTYAFVYKKQDASGTPVNLDQPITITVGDEVGANVYRYDYKKATCTAGEETTNDDTDDVYDAQKGVKYFSKDVNNVYKMETAFIGQNVSNAYIKDGSSNYVLASGYAVTGTDYYYTTDNGINYTKAHNEAYAQFASDVTGDRIYTYNGTTYTKVTGITTPEDNTAYYYFDSSDSKYHWCIFLPQQTKDWYELDESKKVLCNATEKAIDGQTYFDRYFKNNGVYYAKVIKVQ